MEQIFRRQAERTCQGKTIGANHKPSASRMRLTECVQSGSGMDPAPALYLNTENISFVPENKIYLLISMAPVGKPNVCSKGRVPKVRSNCCLHNSSPELTFPFSFLKCKPDVAVISAVLSTSSFGMDPLCLTFEPENF